ncbi:MAG: SPFH domain-containing protein [Rhodobacteraceae bacterium]|mgnify:CR=1 FL=1|uniref:SPFH domain-containing protein n=1 Tax=Amaricoccus sp. TaxID=1872485 RepID=UPI001DB877BE|nr:SPFH domain-containing protein [Amaricoccus sp.]MCB1371969.1 SPFH domain-containing protein [Paracoccaceae bacterium]MCB1373125.1 SPFH domain-containing protein [Paracoccaceae bacterium]MCC0068175.1 SPFH domain-containing protein [Rhodovulum sp.]HRW15618.1 SPFH domain-containing protein [Amaricoccus sp.]
MSIFDFLRGEFIDVIHWTDDTRDTIVWRFEREGHAIKYGAKLTVREGQAAVFVHEGQLADVFGPGLYMLETNNMPVLTTLQHWDHGFRSPFKSEIYFVNTRLFTDLKWGTRNPVMCRDPEFGMVRLRAFGTYTMRVTDPGKFMTEIVGTDGEFTTDEIEFQIRNIIVTHFTQIIATSGIPVLDMAGNNLALAKLVHERIAPMVAEYGLALPAFMIENISLPAEVEAAMDKRTATGVAGDLARYTEFSAAEAMTRSADNPGGGGGIGAGLGAGMGMAMAERMARRGPWGEAPVAGATPPVPPPGVVQQWHVAEDGAAKGPFSAADLRQMAATGTLTGESWVWTPGSAGWRRAGEVPEVAALLGQVPPPPPAA